MSLREEPSGFLKGNCKILHGLLSDDDENNCHNF